MIAPSSKAKANSKFRRNLYKKGRSHEQPFVISLRETLIF
jgi:hypothetical protein